VELTMPDNENIVERDKKPDVLVALGLALAFAVWLYVLGTHLVIEVNARVDNDVAVLPSEGVVVTNFAASALAPLLLLCAYFLREKPRNGDDTLLLDGARYNADSGITGFFLNLLGIILGCGIGWGLAVFLVPFDDVDGAIYSKIGAGVTTFLSGFVASYVPRLVKTQLTARPKAFLVQVGLGAAALLITGLTVTTNRTEYLEFARLEHADESAVEAREKADIQAVKARYAFEYAQLRGQRLAEQLAKTPKVQKEIEQKKREMDDRWSLLLRQYRSTGP
jgi:hypothetical protein